MLVTAQLLQDGSYLPAVFDLHGQVPFLEQSGVPQGEGY